MNRNRGCIRPHATTVLENGGNYYFNRFFRRNKSGDHFHRMKKPWLHMVVCNHGFRKWSHITILIEFSEEIEMVTISIE
jgi:hypothetical protein